MNHYLFIIVCTKKVDVMSLCSFCDHRHGLANSAVHFSLSCIGNESHILNCEQRPIINGSCTHLNDIEIICCKLIKCVSLNKANKYILESYNYVGESLQITYNLPFALPYPPRVHLPSIGTNGITFH